jgi:hypothetical protein
MAQTPERKREWSRLWREQNPELAKKTAATQYKKLRTQRNKLMAVLKDHPCTDCGHKFPAVCMDWDHVRGEKSFNIGQLTAHTSWTRVLEEIAKCELVCANCHRLRTERRRNHGRS